jgi:hypothetical protein
MTAEALRDAHGPGIAGGTNGDSEAPLSVIRISSFPRGHSDPPCKNVGIIRIALVRITPPRAS